MLRLQSVIRYDGWGTCMVALWHMIDDLALDVAKNCGKYHHIPYRCINRNSLSSFVRHCMVCATCCKQHVYAADKDDDGVDNKAGDGADDGADEWKIDIYLLRLPCLFIDMDISNTTASPSLSLSLCISLVCCQCQRSTDTKQHVFISSIISFCCRCSRRSCCVVLTRK